MGPVVPSQNPSHRYTLLIPAQTSPGRKSSPSESVLRLTSDVQSRSAWFTEFEANEVWSIMTMPQPHVLVMTNKRPLTCALK
jgi:hypothetical protein